MKMDDNHSEDDSVTAKHLFLSLSLYQYPGTYLSVKTSDPSFLKYHQAKKKKRKDISYLSHHYHWYASSFRIYRISKYHYGFVNFITYQIPQDLNR